ncbi:chitin deacetylase 7-like [Dreissena polymorpha]|nr:chitin deacetylase 7-like [Dreissena polymorpha]
MRVLLVIAVLVVAVSAQQCSDSNCQLPNCRCFNDRTTPGKLQKNDIPQIVMVSFEGTVTKTNVEFYKAILQETNPNNCAGRGTFFITDEGSDYSVIKALYDDGHEVGISSIRGTAPNSSTDWINEFKKVKSQLESVGVKSGDINGVRVPQLSIGSDNQFIGMGSNGLNYDSSCSNAGLSDASTMIWPFTMDYMPTATCDNGAAPTLPFPGKWEVLISDYHDLSGDKLPCVVPSACRNITTKRDAFDLFFASFTDHYTNLRTPFNMLVDPAWASNPDLRDGTIEFLQYVRAAFGNSVWIVPIQKTIQWIQNPTPIANLTTFAPWGCK